MTPRVLPQCFMSLVSACTGSASDGEVPHFVEPDSLFASPILGSVDLRLKEGFDYSTYYGVILSSASLEELWSQLVNVKRGQYGRRARVPDPPVFDFARYVVLWFADRGAGASFVDSLELSTVSGSDSVLATVHVFHSDFGSRRLNLWQMTRTARPVAFDVKHGYETRVP